MQRTASSTVAASPSTSTSPSSSARTPARKSWWSSTMTTLGACPVIAPARAAARPRCPPRPRCARRRRRRGARMRPTIDSRTPRRSVGHGVGVEARAAVAHEHLDALLADLGVDGHRLRSGELGGVDERLARGGDERLGARVERAVADRHDVDGDAVVLLDLGRGELERRRERAALAQRAPAVQPRAQLALLAAREAGHLARVLRPALHQRERLQHRVVQVRGELGALLRADALGALVGEPAHEPDPPRREDQRARDDHDDDRQQDVARRSQRVVEVEEQQRRADDERDAERGAAERAALRPPRPAPRRPARDRRRWRTGARSARRPPRRARRARRARRRPTAPTGGTAAAARARAGRCRPPRSRSRGRRARAGRAGRWRALPRRAARPRRARRAGRRARPPRSRR